MVPLIKNMDKKTKIIFGSLLIFVGFLLLVSSASASVISEQPVADTVNTNSCTNNCGTFVGFKTTRVSFDPDSLSLSDTSVFYSSFYASMQGGSYGEFLINPYSAVEFFNESGFICRITGYFDSPQIASLAISELSSPVLFEVTLSEQNVPCSGVATSAVLMWGDGNWNGAMATRTDGTTPYYVFSGATIPSGTYIDWVNPPEVTPMEITASTTVNFQFDYMLQSTSRPDSADFTHILLTLTRENYPELPALHYTVTNSVVLDTPTSVSLEVDLPNVGYHLGLVSFWNGVEQSTECPWWNFWCIEQDVKIFATNSNRFQVATTTVPAILPPFVAEGFGSMCADLNSGFLFGLDVAVCKALVAVFVPSGSLWESDIEILKGQLSQRLPFAGFFLFMQGVDEVASGSYDMSADIEVDVGFYEGTMFSWDYARAFWLTVSANPQGGAIANIMNFALAIFVLIGMASIVAPRKTL